MNNGMGRERAAKFYQAGLDNPKISVDRMIEEVYKKLGKTPEEIEKLKQEYHDYVNEVKSLGLNGMDAVDEMKESKDIITQIDKDENGNTMINIQKGDPKFGGITIPGTPVPNSPDDIKFGDEEILTIVDNNVNTSNNTGISPQNIPAFGDTKPSGIEIVDNNGETIKTNFDFPNGAINKEDNNPPKDNIAFGDSNNVVKTDNSQLNFPNTESGLIINGEEPKQNNVRTDDFQFGDQSTNPPQSPTDGNIGNPGTGSGPKL